MSNNILSPERAESIVNSWHTDPLSIFAQQQKQARFIKPVRPSKTHSLASRVTKMVIARLEAMDLEVNETTHKCAWDLWAGPIRVEIKASNWTVKKSGYGRFQAHLGKSQVAASDVIIFAVKNGTWHYFIIPARAITGKTLEINSYDVHEYGGKYSPFLEAWNLLVDVKPKQSRLL